MAAIYHITVYLASMPRNRIHQPFSFFSKPKPGGGVCFGGPHHGLGPNPCPGRLPWNSDLRAVELASVFASVASLAVSFVLESIFWNPGKTKKQEVASKTCGWAS